MFGSCNTQSDKSLEIPVLRCSSPDPSNCTRLKSSFQRKIRYTTNATRVKTHSSTLMLHWCHSLKVLKHRSGVSQNAWDVKTGITTRKNCCLSFLSDQNSSVQTSNVWKMPPKRPIAVWVAYHFLMTSGRLRLPTPQQQPVAGGVFSSLAMLIVSGETRPNSWELLYPKCRFRMTFCWHGCHCTSALATF